MDSKKLIVYLALVTACGGGEIDLRSSSERATSDSRPDRMLGLDDEADREAFFSVDVEAPVGARDTSLFDRAREKRFAMPLSYREVIGNVKRQLAIYQKAYLGVETAPDGVKIEDPALVDCRTKRPLERWKDRYVFHVFAPLAEAFYACSVIFRDDPIEPEIARACESAVITIADHILAHSNATDFSAYVFKDGKGRATTPLGWNGVPSAWDAWNNGSCSSPATPSLQATASALDVLALASSLTEDQKYLDAIKKTMGYFHQARSIDLAEIGRIDPEAPRIQAFYTNLQRQGRIGKYVVTPTYTVGASRYRLAEGGKTGERETLFYHYNGESDPGRNSLNANATMGQALFYAGILDRETKLAVARVDGSFVPMSYLDIAMRTMYPIHANVGAGNLSHVDVDDIGYDGAAITIEAHAFETIAHLARAGGVTGNSFFIESALKAAHAIDALKLAPVPSNARAACILRAKSERLMQTCRRALKETPRYERHFLWAIWNSLVLPETWVD